MIPYVRLNKLKQWLNDFVFVHTGSFKNKTKQCQSLSTTGQSILCPLLVSLFLSTTGHCCTISFCVNIGGLHQHVTVVGMLWSKWLYTRKLKSLLQNWADINKVKGDDPRHFIVTKPFFFLDNIWNKITSLRQNRNKIITTFGVSSMSQVFLF